MTLHIPENFWLVDWSLTNRYRAADKRHAVQALVGRLTFC
jgi:hypothetical protein